MKSSAPPAPPAPYNKSPSDKTPINPWLGTVVSASKTLAVDKPQMQAYLEAVTSQQKLYQADTKALDQLSKRLEGSPDLQTWLKEIGAETQNSPKPPLK